MIKFNLSHDGQRVRALGFRRNFVGPEVEIRPRMKYGLLPTRLMITRKQIQDFAERVAQEFHPEKIILFGSYAYGRPTEDSDVDLLVIMPFRGSSNKKAVEIDLRVRRAFAMDLIVRTPAKVRERVRLGDWFMREITEKGQVLYDATRS